ncbi:B12-binding domain-containing radical SAM protein [Candidatus Viridilinea mediisalina]|uniref:B12-binding domain-containing radical SAM protein n=1 Tax=Candidatus Viridilinea mediisalina TaxID=2024553 RepID=A0A2A6RP56_9CHLR|nr:radical SAM protein [Candidatus Viridilinea mediisalina]PDW04696.1 B12-binding domain-containing radical SAM protein [Candidatus Viridilinea mediisalina]
MSTLISPESLELAPPPFVAPPHRKRWLLIQPKSNTPLMVDSGKVSMPLNLLMVASMLKEHFLVDFLDERVGDEVPQDFTGYDIVALTSRTLNAKRVYAIADRARAQGKKVILGGVHPTMMIDEAREHCDTVVFGEIESIYDELTRDIYADQLKPLYRPASEAGWKPMSTLDQPDFSFARRSPNSKHYSFRLPLLATKGCPVGCNFCCTPRIYGKNFRMREVERVIDEIRMRQYESGKPNIHFSFMDDNISFRPAFADALFNAMVGMGVKWNANISMNFLEKPEVSALAKEAGCQMLNVGFESVSPETIKHVHKGSNRTARYDEIVSNVHKQGIALQGYFIFGFDTDTPASFQHTYDFIMQNRIEFPVFTIATPFPGTPWYEEVRHRLVQHDWDKYDTFHYMYEPAKMQRDEFLRNFIKVQREIYSWPNIWKRMAGRKLDWVWLVNVAMHHFTQRLTPATFM